MKKKNENHFRNDDQQLILRNLFRLLSHSKYNKYLIYLDMLTCEFKNSITRLWLREGRCMNMLIEIVLQKDIDQMIPIERALRLFEHTCRQIML